MDRIRLVFPDTESIAAFLITYRISNAEVNSLEHSLIAVLSEDQRLIAEELFHAVHRPHLIYDSANDE
jgi:hypothetical protein